MVLGLYVYLCVDLALWLFNLLTKEPNFWIMKVEGVGAVLAIQACSDQSVCLSKGKITRPMAGWVQSCLRQRWKVRVAVGQISSCYHRMYEYPLCALTRLIGLCSQSIFLRVNTPSFKTHKLWCVINVLLNIEEIHKKLWFKKRI